MRSIVFAVCLSVAPAICQEFEVASIKPSAPHTGGPMRVGMQIAPGGRVIATNFTLKQLVQQAFQVKDFQITDGPAWINSDRWDINAKGSGEGPISPDQIRPMMQALLKERFHLEFHKESKELPVYHLVAAKGGFKLKALPPEEVPPAAMSPGGVGGAAGIPRGARMMRMGRGSINAQGVPVSLLATQLGGTVGKDVIDKTDIKGLYNIKLEWTPEPGEGGAMFGGGAGPGGPGAGPHAGGDSNGPSLFTALQEQIGLKLEAARGPVDIMILDRAEKPTEN